MGILTWIIMGALAGWIASLVMKTDEQQGAVANIAVGVVGAFIGGFLAELLGFSGITGFNLGSILIATLGAIILIFILKKFRGPKSSPVQ